MLIVDDSPLQRRILAKTLQKWGFDVFEASTAEEAFQMCAEQMPDFVISDWIMPGASGIEFCRKFREITRACGHSGFPLGLISDSNFQNGGLNERAAVCGVGHLVAAA